MKICILGTGYVGLVTGTCLSDFGLEVICVDKDSEKIKGLNNGKIPIYEPNLEALIKKNVSAGRLTFTNDLENAVKYSKVIFIAVGTPSNNDGSANLKQVEKVAQQIATSMNGESIPLSLRGAKRRGNLNLPQNLLTSTSSPTPNSSGRAPPSMTLPILTK